jgi:hypothetical protein
VDEWRINWDKPVSFDYDIKFKFAEKVTSFSGIELYRSIMAR